MAGVLQADADLLVRVLAPGAEAFLQGGGGGGQHEDHAGIRDGPVEGASPGGLDVQQHIPARGQHLLQPGPARAVAVGVDLDPLHEGVFPHHGVEGGIVDEEVLPPVHLARAGLAGGEGDGEDQVRQAGHQALGERGLAGPRGRRDHEHAAGMLNQGVPPGPTLAEGGPSRTPGGLGPGVAGSA